MLVVKKIKPLFNRIVTTAEVFENDVTKNGIVIYAKGTVKPYQKVVGVGSMVRDIEVGDLVEIDPTAYIKKKYGDNTIRDDMDANPKESVCIPTVELDGVNHFLIYDRDIEYVITDHEDIADLPVTKLIKPKTPSLII